VNPEDNGVVYGAQSAADRNGALSSAYWFDGVDDYIQIPHPVVSNPPFSVSLWFNAYDITPNAQYLISSPGFSGTSAGMYCKLLGKAETAHARSSWPKSGVQCGVTSAENGFFAIVTREDITSGEWHHIALIWDGGQDAGHVELYIDGKLAPALKETGARDGTASPENVRIGAPGDSTSELLFKGTLDDIRLYNRVISEDEIQQLSHYIRKQIEELFDDDDDDE
jgi:hypothetical protein